jgi:hypothetical protein
VNRTKRVPGHQGDDGRRELLPVVVDYKPTPFGTWVGVLEIPGHPARRVQASDAHQALHAALDQLKVIVDETGLALATVHQLNGDPEAWAQLAVENDFAHCAMHTGHDTAFLTEAWGKRGHDDPG